MKVVRECSKFMLQQSFFGERFRQSTFILTLRETLTGDKHLLNPTSVDVLREYLYDVNIKSKATTASTLITTAQGDWFCGGFDHSYAESPGLNNGFREVVKDLISLPMPTIAAVNGYAFEAGLMLALGHDHLTMKQRGKPFLKAEVLSRKSSYPAYFTALIRSKVGSPLARRRLVLGDEQIDAQQAARFGLLDDNHEVGRDASEIAKFREELPVGKEWNGERYAEIRKKLYPELCKELGLTSSRDY